MDTQDREEPFGFYRRLVSSYIHGFRRFASARIAALSLQTVVLAYQVQPRIDVSAHPYADVLRRIDEVEPREYAAFEYIYNVSSLVYLTTLLDTFLSDTTKFLLLLHPRAIGSDQVVPLEAILGAKSTSTLLTNAAAKKTREVSYLPFSGRIDFLRRRFGLRLDLDETSLVRLEHYASLRNMAVHDQAVFDCSIDATGRLVVQQKACPLHPTLIHADDIREAASVYHAVTGAVCRAVVEQVLKASDHPGYKDMKSLFEREDGANIGPGTAVTPRDKPGSKTDSKGRAPGES